MKRFTVLLTLIILTGCASKPDFENYEYSYSKSGGLAPTYENLFLAGREGQYFYEGQNRKYSKSLKLTRAEQNTLATAIASNRLQTVREDYKKFYDFVATTIKVKNPNIRKTNGSGIMPQDQQRWQNVVDAFEKIINDKKLRQ